MHVLAINHRDLKAPCIRPLQFQWHCLRNEQYAHSLSGRRPLSEDLTSHTLLKSIEHKAYSNYHPRYKIPNFRITDFEQNQSLLLKIFQVDYKPASQQK